MERSVLWSIGCAAALAPASVAQSFNYVDFSSTSGLVLNGNAAASGSVLRVTPAASDQKGSVWYSQPIDVIAGFDTTFTFRITQLTGGGADGLAFVIQDDPRGTAALGDKGSSMGYGAEPTSPAGTALSNSLAIEIDTYFIASPWGDPDGNHLSIHTNGTGENNAYESLSIGLASPATNMSNGSVHTLRVRYNPGVLDIYLDNLSTPLLSANYSFVTGGSWTGGGSVGGLALIGNSAAHVGFTAGTGGATENHDVLSWTWAPIVPPAYCTSGTSGHGCAPAISGNANPSLAFANPCLITVSSVEGQRNGILFYGLTQFVQPWASGSTSYLCIKPPTQRAGSQNSGGTVGLCDGTLSLDWNTFQQSNPTALGNPWSVGREAFCQGWYRDPPAPKTTNLSDALWLTYLP